MENARAQEGSVHAVSPRRDEAEALVRLRAALGPDKVVSDESELEFYSRDVFWEPGVRPSMVVLPESAEEVRTVVGIAAALGLALVPRGAGVSYSKGCLPAVAGSVVVDTSRMNRIIEINEKDLYVTVEAGTTWAELEAATAPLGLRPGFWGPLSGLRATVAGALSQTAAFFGSARDGTDLESVLGVSVVLANGSTVTTGSASRRGTKPFTREGGPDMTGLFLGDNGAFGIKVRATLRLKPRPAEIGYLSFGFATMTELAAAQVALARERLAGECFGIDRAKAEQSASVNRLSEGARTLGRVVRSGKNLASGLRNATSVATAGTSFLLRHNFTLHMTIEAAGTAELGAMMGRARRHAVDSGGTEIEASVPTVLRSSPFGPLKGMTGRNGERWVPMNVVFPLGEAERVIAASDRFFADRAELLQKHSISVSVMSMTCGSEFFYAPAFYWDDALNEVHVRTLGSDVVRPWMNHSPNPDNRNAVARLRRECQEMYAEMGGVGWQVGRDAPYRENLQPETWEFLVAMKQALDPGNIMNPGALGFDLPAR